MSDQQQSVIEAMSIVINELAGKVVDFQDRQTTHLDLLQDARNMLHEQQAELQSLKYTMTRIKESACRSGLETYALQDIRVALTEHSVRHPKGI